MTLNRPGDIIDESYELIEPVGAGSFSLTWKAMHLRLDRHVAVKIISFSSLDAAGVSEEEKEAKKNAIASLFFREARILSAIYHENVINILDVHQDRLDGHYMVTEFLDGKSLEDIISSRQKLTVPETLRYSLAVLDGLKAIHNKNIIHRGILPAGITVFKSDSGKEQVKIADFGSAKFLDPARYSVVTDREEPAPGALAYMSPEQVRGQDSGPDRRADLYSVGVIMYECISGKVPIEGGGRRETEEKIVSGELVPLRSAAPGLAPGIYGIVERALQKDRERRFQNAQEFIEKIEAVLEEEKADAESMDEAPAIEILVDSDDHGAEPGRRETPSSSHWHEEEPARDANDSGRESILDTARAHYLRKDWDNASKCYQMILMNNMGSQNTDETIEAYCRLGNIKMNLDEPRKARNMYEKALALDPRHRPALEGMIGLFEKQGEFERVIQFKKAIAESADEGEKFVLLVEIGDIRHENLYDGAAIAAYDEALGLRPTDRSLLLKLANLCSSTKQWPKAVEALKRLADLEEDGPRRAHCFRSIAETCLAEIKDIDQAVAFHNKALDSDPENLKSFEAIESILVPLQDWKQLERNYRKMLHRVSGRSNAVLEESFLLRLGDIYRTRMHDLEAAAEAHRLAAKINPGNVACHEILAELYETAPGKWQDAADEHHILIRRDPNRIESYKALRRIYMDARRYDRAWCMCATLSFLKKADEEEQRFFEQYRMKGLPRARQALDNEQWVRDLLHPGEDVFIGKIFELITHPVFRTKVQPHKKYGLKKKDRKDPFTDTEAVVRIFGTLGRVLNLPLPELYVYPDQAAGLQYAITEPPASVVGKALLSGHSPQDLTFIVTKHLSYYRGEHYIRLMEPTAAGLETQLLAAIKLAAPGYRLPQDAAERVTPVVKTLKSGLSPAQKEQLARVVEYFIDSKAEADLKRWCASVELTACRAGLLLCNDLQSAARAVSAEPPGMSDVSPGEKVKELVVFSVSENNFRLREALGFNVGGPAA
ncbi:MAG: protein kinase [Pseudomonadota bacterium]